MQFTSFPGRTRADNAIVTYAPEYMRYPTPTIVHRPCTIDHRTHDRFHFIQNHATPGWAPRTARLTLSKLPATFSTAVVYTGASAS